MHSICANDHFKRAHHPPRARPPAHTWSSALRRADHMDLPHLPAASRLILEAAPLPCARLRPLAYKRRPELKSLQI